MLKKWALAVLLAAMVVTGAGCGTADGEKAEKEAKVAKITFGDYPQDEGRKELIKPRGHFGKDEDIALEFDLPSKETFDSSLVKVKVLKQPGNKLQYEFETDVDPTWDSFMWEFTDSSDFPGFYDPGEYTIQILRGKELLAEGDLEIID
ncbi:hypothetical protein [Salinithrix halophila]|uniref:Intracellular proteinase inhibitor BsuPI domain-containing protein n=1 Tax=Salinithrix halophila TaxID=1485204 RepID=A0ABV8JEC6_9BACL